MPEVTPTPSNTGKKSHVWLWVLLVVLVLIALGLVTCTWALKLIFTPSNVEVTLNTNTSVPPLILGNTAQSRVESEITDSDLALALIAEEDISEITGLGQVRPSILELNDHLDNTPPENYSFFVARSWFTVPDGEMKIGTALVKNANAVDAQDFLTIRSQGKTILSGAPQLGDSAVMYYEPAVEDVAASVTVRFSLNTLAAKVQVFSTQDLTTDAEIQATLVPLAKAVAQAQTDRLDSFLANTLPEFEQTPPLVKAPRTLPGATLIGTVFLSEEEWLGVTGDFRQEADVEGLLDGAVSHFLITARPEEVVEVSVMQFFTNSLAERFQAELLVDPDLTGSTEVELAGSLATAADALASESIVEMQIVVENYVIDVSIFSPFGTLDAEAAKADLVTMGQDILNNFSAE